VPDFFDRLIDEMVRAKSAPRSESTVTPAAQLLQFLLLRSALPHSRWRRQLLIGTALLCGPGAVGGLALAGTFSGRRITPQQWVDGQRVQPESAIPTAQAADLGILRRRREASDALPPSAVFSATHTPMAANGGNPSLSRRARGVVDGAAWIVPGNGVVCLIASNGQDLAMARRKPASSSTPTPTTRTPGAGGAAGCTTDSRAAAGWSAGAGGTSESPGVAFTAGIVPDGVRDVAVSVAGGGLLPVAVHENVYMAEIHGWPSSITFVGRAGRVTINNGRDVLAHLARIAGDRRASNKR